MSWEDILKHDRREEREKEFSKKRSWKTDIKLNERCITPAVRYFAKKSTPLFKNYLDKGVVNSGEKEVFDDFDNDPQGFIRFLQYMTDNLSRNKKEERDVSEGRKAYLDGLEKLVNATLKIYADCDDLEG